MFSQFRQAVENLAQPLPRSSQDNASSLDVHSQSSTVLAENALVNLRKSIAAQRTANPTPQNLGTSRPRSASPGPSSTAKSTGDSGLRKTTLEERLRASFVTSDSTVGTSPSPTASPSPAPHAVPVTQHPLSPASTPLPESPTLASVATFTLDTPVGCSVQIRELNDILPLQERDDALQLPGITLSDSQGFASPNVDSADSMPTDPIAEPCGYVAPAQEAPQQANTDHQHHTEPPSQIPDVVDPPTIHTNPPGEVCVTTDPDTMTPGGPIDTSVEALRERLKLMEQRLTDVSTSFKKLQVERRNIDDVISELTPLEGSRDVAALREYLSNVNTKIELGQDELQRLGGKMMRQDERLEELRDIHRLETTSQSNQIEKLRRQLSEAEALIAASQSTTSQTQEDNVKRDSEIEQLRTQVSKANEIAKEEEEKRVKAISLLKTVRQKLVKAEKERDDTSRELNEMRDRNSQEKEKDRVERANLEREVNAVSAEREKAVTGLRAQFDKDLAAAKDRAERDIQAVKKVSDTEMHALKTSHSAELATKSLRINALEDAATNLTNENKIFFEQSELRQAELESSQCHAESLQAQNTELQFQLKELQERITLLGDEVGELRGEHEIRPQIPGASAEEIVQLVTSIESKYEAKLSELRRTLTTAERDRTEAEASWSRKLTEKTEETDELKRMLQSSTRLREQDEDTTGELKAKIETLQAEARTQRDRIHELQAHVEASNDAESTLHQRLSDIAAHADDNGKELEESKSREAQLRTQNKALWDELRKVQNSVTVLERQRIPGVGYWSSTSRSEGAESRTSISSMSDGPVSSRSAVKNEEEINYEYLRNVIFQFLEHKEMRPNLVRVLSTILRFTPQETRRLMSKV